MRSLKNILSDRANVAVILKMQKKFDFFLCFACFKRHFQIIEKGILLKITCISEFWESTDDFCPEHFVGDDF